MLVLYRSYYLVLRVRSSLHSFVILIFQLNTVCLFIPAKLCFFTFLGTGADVNKKRPGFPVPLKFAVIELQAFRSGGESDCSSLPRL